MPRYLVERSFQNGLALSADEEGAAFCRELIASSAWDQVTWIHSYVTRDKRKSFCIYDAPNPEAIRRVAANSGLPVDRITEVRVLDPYFYV